MMEKTVESEQRLVSRRGFITAAVLTGAGLTITGVLPVSPTVNVAPSESSVEAMSLDGEFQIGKRIPVYAKSEMLEIESIQVVAKKGSMRADVRFRFADGRLDGGAMFQLDLFDKSGTLLASQIQTEMRNRQLVVQKRPSLAPVEGDRPNRAGKAEFRFPDLAPTANVSRFTLEVWPLE